MVIVTMVFGVQLFHREIILRSYHKYRTIILYQY